MMEQTAKSIMESADCAIGYEAANMVYKGLIGYRDDYVEHIQNGRCTCAYSQPVPCVSLCPAHVDIPGYIALVGAGRYADAIRLIRKDNPFPTTCGFICEHPCEARCRRNMVDDSINIRGLKRMGGRLCRRGRPAGMCTFYRQKDCGSGRRSGRPERSLLLTADGTSGNRLRDASEAWRNAQIWNPELSSAEGAGWMMILMRS